MLICGIQPAYTPDMTTRLLVTVVEPRHCNHSTQRVTECHGERDDGHEGSNDSLRVLFKPWKKSGVKQTIHLFGGPVLLCYLSVLLKGGWVANPFWFWDSAPKKKTLIASVPRRYRYWRLCNVHAAPVCSWQMIIQWANSAPHAGLLQFTQLINFNFTVPVNWTPLRIRVYLTSSEHWVAIGGATSKSGDISCIQLGGTPQAPPFVTRWYWRSPRLAAEGWAGIVETRS
jgi:hypothetical protein